MSADRRKVLASYSSWLANGSDVRPVKREFCKQSVSGCSRAPRNLGANPLQNFRLNGLFAFRAPPSYIAQGGRPPVRRVFSPVLGARIGRCGSQSEQALGSSEGDSKATSQAQSPAYSLVPPTTQEHAVVPPSHLLVG